MKRLLLLSCFLAVAASADVKRGDYQSKTTTLAVQASGCTTATDSDCTTFGLCGTITNATPICASTSAAWFIGEFTNVVITVTNSGSNTLSDVLVQVSNNGSSWQVIDDTTYDELAAGATKSSGLVGNAYRWMRITGRSASGTDVVATISANDG